MGKARSPSRLLRVIIAIQLLMRAAAAPASLEGLEESQANQDGAHVGDIHRVRVAREAWTSARISNRLANMGSLAGFDSNPAIWTGSVPDIYTAVTFGNGHVITYDGKLYQFAGQESSECIHVLARDHVAHHFTIMKNRDKISLITQQTAITLHSNNKVEVNNTGSFRDLPVQSWDNSLAVTHDNTAVIVQTRTGISIECDLYHRQCLYQLSGAEHFNHTLGLLGTNDGRPDNDMVKRTGQVASDSQEFANSYELSGLPYCRPAAAPAASVCPSHTQASRCRHLFRSSSSPLSPCFGQVNTDPFLEACEIDANICAPNKARMLCEAVVAFSRVCKAHGIKVTPGECGECQEHSFGDTWYEQVDRKLDIVLITSLSENILPGSTQLPDVLQHLSDAIVQLPRRHQGVRHNIRFGLLGYGGRGYLQSPHVYTIQGQSFTRQYSNAIWRQTLQSVQSYSDIATDPVAALETAASYPFRPDATKIVFLFTDSSFTPGQTRALQSLQARYASQGLSLNVIATYSQLANRNILGLRGRDSSLILSPHARSTSHTVTFPTDIAARLAQSTEGAIFDLRKVAQGRHHMAHAVQDHILDQLVQQTSRCRQCRCGAGSYGHGAISCDVRRCL